MNFIVNQNHPCRVPRLTIKPKMCQGGGAVEVADPARCTTGVCIPGARVMLNKLSAVPLNYMASRIQA